MPPPNSQESFPTELLQQSVVDDTIEGAIQKTILNFLKENWLQLTDQKTSKIFAAFNEAFWVSRQTVFKMDTATGVFGKRIRPRNSQTELLLASFKNMLAQFQFIPFFPDSVKGDLQLIPLKIKNAESGSMLYGITDSFCLDVIGQNPIEFSVYLGDGRSLRDLRRMIEENADIRALKDVFGYLEDVSYSLFPLLPYHQIERGEDHLSLTIRKTIHDEICQLKITVEGLRHTSTQELDIRESINPKVFSYFLLDEAESNLAEGDKGWNLLKKIPKKTHEWFEKKHLRFRRFTESGEETRGIPLPEENKYGFIPPQYEKYWNTHKKDLVIIEILVPRYTIVTPKSGASLKIVIEYTLDTTKYHYSPKPVKLNNIFKKEVLEFIYLLQNAKSLEGLVDEKIMSLLNMLEAAYRSLSFLIMDETVVAGAFTYLTYFGRDTVFTYLLLKPFLQTCTQQKMVQHLLNRANQDGEAAHEIDSRVLKGREDHYDYRMRDTDFLMAISAFELLQEMNEDEIKAFLNYQEADNRYNIYTRDSDKFLTNAVVIFRNLNRILNTIAQNDLIPLKRENDPSSANWRDAVNSFSRGTYPYDVNAVWVPHLLCLLEAFVNNGGKKAILLDLLVKIKASFLRESYDQIEYFFRSEKDVLRKMIDTWMVKTKKKFAVRYSLDEWRTRLKTFYNEPENQNSSVQDLKKMKIGYYLREHGLGKVWFTAEEFLDDKKWEDRMLYQIMHLKGKFFLPNGNPFPKGIRTYVMALDRDKKPIPIMHSDLGFEAFTKSMRGEKIEKELILPTELPIPLGGLAILDKNGESLGFSVANPMLADKNGYELLLTPREKKKGVDPRALSPWKLLGKNAYHGWGAVWEVMIDFMIAALQDADLQSQDYLKKHYWWLLENYTRFPRVRNKEVLGFKYYSNYEDWFLTEATVEKFEINDLQVFNSAGRLRVLLKSLIPGVTKFWLFKQMDKRNRKSKNGIILKKPVCQT